MTEFEQKIVQMLESLGNAVNSNLKEKVETVKAHIPTLESLFKTILPTIPKEHQRKLTERVFKTFLSLVPPSLKINELKTLHFQLYIHHRKTQIGKITKKPIQLSTIYKELYSMTNNLKEIIKVNEQLTDWQFPSLPKLPTGYKKKNKRERLVTDQELTLIIAELSQKPHDRVTSLHYITRCRVAHILEFGYWTGLRRKEIAALRFSQYDPDRRALLNVARYKTDSATNFLPLGKRAVEIIEERREMQGGSQFIFTDNGKPIDSTYRMIRQTCEKLKIPYGRYTDGGFISHDLRHNFATGILQVSDIETARVLLGHSDILQTQTYIHTNQQRLEEAVSKRDKIGFTAIPEKIDIDFELKKIFDAVKSEEADLVKFTQAIKTLFGGV